jgi:hypothetical protein
LPPEAVNVTLPPAMMLCEGGEMETVWPTVLTVTEAEAVLL